MRGDPTCSWAEGCELSVSLCDGREHGLCWYHYKMRQGLIDRPKPRKGQEKPAPKRKPLISQADVLSAEQEEMAVMAVKLGASPGAVRRALFRFGKGPPGG